MRTAAKSKERLYPDSNKKVTNEHNQIKGWIVPKFKKEVIINFTYVMCQNLHTKFGQIHFKEIKFTDRR
jgi:hypothetical protein